MGSSKELLFFAYAKNPAMIGGKSVVKFACSSTECILSFPLLMDNDGKITIHNSLFIALQINTKHCRVLIARQCLV